LAEPSRAVDERKDTIDVLSKTELVLILIVDCAFDITGL